MVIQVIGSGCSNCKRLLGTVQEAAKGLAGPVEIQYVTDMEGIVKSGVMSTPGLVVDGRVLSMGRVPGLAEVRRLIGAES